MSRVDISLQFLDLMESGGARTSETRQESEIAPRGPEKPFRQSYIDYIDHQQQFLRSNARNLSGVSKSQGATTRKPHDLLDYPRPWLNARPLDTRPQGGACASAVHAPRKETLKQEST